MFSNHYVWPCPWSISLFATYSNFELRAYYIRMELAFAATMEFPHTNTNSTHSNSEIQSKMYVKNSGTQDVWFGKTILKYFLAKKASKTTKSNIVRVQLLVHYRIFITFCISLANMNISTCVRIAAMPRLPRIVLYIFFVLGYICQTHALWALKPHA